MCGKIVLNPHPIKIVAVKKDLGTVEIEETEETGVKIVDGVLSVTDSTGKLYRFREPRGKDLLALNRATEVDGKTTLEALLLIMAGLSLDRLKETDFTDLPMDDFKLIAQELNQFFRD